jgi:hypothetical protein
MTIKMTTKFNNSSAGLKGTSEKSWSMKVWRVGREVLFK